MDCNDQYYNLQPSTNVTKHYAFLNGFLKGKEKAKSAWSPVLGYEKAQQIHVLAVTKET